MPTRPEVVLQLPEHRHPRWRKTAEHRHSRRKKTAATEPTTSSSSSSSNLAGRDQIGATMKTSYVSQTTKEPGPQQEVEQQQQKDNGEEDEELLDPAKHSFSNALRECQNRRITSKAYLSDKKHRRRRTASLDDLNTPATASDVTLLSPRFIPGELAGMRRGSAASLRSRSDTVPSPGTPNYQHNGVVGVSSVYQKGWSSERVPLPVNSSRRYATSTSIFPFGNGRPLPSKWEDAEKWICSPVSLDGSVRQAAIAPHHRRPKSKSGPLGAPGGIGIGVSSLSASPLISCYDSERANFTTGSPFLAGVLVANRGSCCHGSGGRASGQGVGRAIDVDGGRRSYSTSTEPYVVRSASVHGWSDVLLESSSSLPSSQGEKIGSVEVGTRASPPILRKDMATQMSPERSCNSSPNRRPSISPSMSLACPVVELDNKFCKLEVRDVPVDDRVTMTRWSKKNISRGFEKRSTNLLQWTKKSAEAPSCSWDVAETPKRISSHKREEARITAWENLQKAKAEAAIRKLEMKLEKKRSSSMDKILSKLKSAQKKAQEMRSAVNASEDHCVTRINRKVSYFRRTGQISSLNSCFTCPSF